MSDEELLDTSILGAFLDHAGAPDHAEASWVALEETDASPATGSAEPEPVPDWREELALKMQEYRTRRKLRGPKYPSLQLPFEQPFEPFRPVSAESASRSSLALERPLEDIADSFEVRYAPELVEAPKPAEAVPATTNLIEFPRYAENPAWDGLAEPFIEQPRILDAPELAPPEPALGGILLEPQEEAQVPATDAALRPASIGRRCAAALVDLLVVGSAAALWGWIFWKAAGEIPPRTELLVSPTGIAGGLWLGYQFLLMIYSGTTLGLRLCRLELVSLDGTIPGRKRRRWRLLASWLSALSLMLGYAWVLLDEDRLCWHDRITCTYLRVRERQLS